MTAEKANKITQGTLVPLALCGTLVAAAWGLATDRARATAALEQHERRITTIEDDIKVIRDGVQRIEKAIVTNQAEGKAH